MGWRAEAEDLVGENAGVEGEAELFGEVGEDFAGLDFAFGVGAELEFDAFFDFAAEGGAVGLVLGGFVEGLAEERAARIGGRGRVACGAGLADGREFAGGDAGFEGDGLAGGAGGAGEGQAGVGGVGSGGSGLMALAAASRATAMASSAISRSWSSWRARRSASVSGARAGVAGGVIGGREWRGAGIRVGIRIIFRRAMQACLKGSWGWMSVADPTGPAIPISLTK